MSSLMDGLPGAGSEQAGSGQSRSRQGIAYMLG